MDTVFIRALANAAGSEFQDIARGGTHQNGGRVSGTGIGDSMGLEIDMGADRRNELAVEHAVHTRGEDPGVYCQEPKPYGNPGSKQPQR